MSFPALTLAMDGVAYGPVKVAGTNANVALPAGIITQASRNAMAVVISCEENAIRYAFGGIIPAINGAGHILYPGSVLKIAHPAAVASFLYINHTSSANASLMITGEYSE